MVGRVYFGSFWQVENEDELNEDDGWEYVEEGPAEIIWQGNEIIVKKKRVRVAKQNADQQPINEGTDRPTSNPLPPQSEVFASNNNSAAVSAQGVFESVAQQIPNFGTEQDKAHCPFHIKTGACRFGSRCSRVHFHPDKSCTLLIKNMYNGPGLAWEQDEGLEHTDEEVERCYEEFYEDVHTEFLKFGEIVNFKVCRNGSFHLRGNVYVHYKSLESAVLAYHSINGRYFAGKQITCEFVGVTRWKVAICGEYMKSRLKTCSRGTACNFIHCFRNPGGDYEWADWDNPPPKYWMKKMASLFGPSDESGYDKSMVPEIRGKQRNFKITPTWDRYPSRRSRSRTVDGLSSSSGGDLSDENKDHESSRSNRHRDSRTSRRKRSSLEHRRYEENFNLEDDRYHDSGDYLERHTDRKNSRSRESKSHSRKEEDFLDEHRNCKERYSSNKDRLYKQDSYRKYHSSRREHSRSQKKVADYEHRKSDKNNLSESPGRYDPIAGHNYTENTDQCDHWELTSFHGEHEQFRRSYNSDDYESSDELYDKNRSSNRKHSNSREEETNSSNEDHNPEETNEIYTRKGRSRDHNQRRRKNEIANKEANNKDFCSRKSKGRSNSEQEKACEKLLENSSPRFALKESCMSPEDSHHSRGHERSSKRVRHCRKKSYEKIEDNTSIPGVHSLKRRASRKRSRSRSPIEFMGRSGRERDRGSRES
ncbi:RNA recognition motif domain [Macleaya cordata]|uniref:RNA recognition motif domain n=1 Tax=Macleaya cordata TaxID=56857 RepID=A0A200QFT3_MACCD|nr:RNA recognition motif domain [Macleaya cordata]